MLQIAAQSALLAQHFVVGKTSRNQRNAENKGNNETKTEQSHTWFSCWGLDREAQSGRSDGRILISYMISRDAGRRRSNCEDRHCTHHPKHEHLHSLQSQECKLRARIEKFLFLLQHNLPQSCEAATRHDPKGCKFYVDGFPAAVQKDGGGTGVSPVQAGRGRPALHQHHIFRTNTSTRTEPDAECRWFGRARQLHWHRLHSWLQRSHCR